MTEQSDQPALPQLHDVAAVARALGCSERYVSDKARRREWPHRRLARGHVAFTDDDYAAVLELVRAAVAPPPTVPRIALAPRSARRRGTMPR